MMNGGEDFSGARPRPAWVKSSLSYANGNCVEVASLAGGQVGVRDSRNRTGPVLRLTPREWRAFVGGIRDGEFESPVVRDPVVGGTVVGRYSRRSARFSKITDRYLTR